MRRAGFTIIEMIVAIGLFVVFGTVLALFMQAGMRSWEDRRAAAYLGAEAQSILGMVASELRAVSLAEPPQDDDYRPLLLSWYPAGVQETSFATEAGPELSAALSEAGNGADDDGDGDVDEEKLNGVDDDGDGRTDEDCRKPPRMRPWLAYFCDPPGAVGGRRFLLWKAFDFEDDLLGVSTEDDFEDRCMLVSSHVAFFEMRFALKRTDTWDGNAAPRYEEGKPVGPSFIWNSARCLLNLEGDPFGDFFYLAPSSDRDEQAVPECVLLVIGMIADDFPFARIQQTMLKDDDTMALDTTEGLAVRGDGEAADIFQVLLVGDEWVVYDALDGNVLHLRRRGAKGTEAADHLSGTEVYRPRVFIREIRLPAGILPY